MQLVQLTQIDIATLMASLALSMEVALRADDRDICAVLHETMTKLVGEEEALQMVEQVMEKVGYPPEAILLFRKMSKELGVIQA